MFYRELLILKEQLFRQKQLDSGYDAEDYEVFNPIAWMEELLGETGVEEEDLETIARKASDALHRINEQFEKEKDLLERKMVVCIQSLFRFFSLFISFF